MSRLMSGHHGSLAHWLGEKGGRRSLARREESLGASRGVLIAGIVAVGVGLLAWHYLGPDVKRYMKIRNM